MNCNHTRLEVATFDTKTVEAIFESYDEAHRAWTAFADRKHAVGQPIGGAVLRRADMPRAWDVSVGEKVRA